MNTISGVSNMMIYEYQGKKYYFFGDYHGTRKGGCHTQGIKCDSFNYDFTDTTNANTSCTTIGALLHNWFKYNNKQGIKTDFYLEEFYTITDERIDNKEYIDSIKNKTNRTQAIFKDKSWMELLAYIMAPCFLREKKQCPYYPNVHLHYIDIRSVNTLNGVVELTPFSMDIVYDYIQTNQPITIEELIILRDDVMYYIHFIIKNYKQMIKFLLSTEGLNDYNDLINIESPIMINNISLLSSNNVFKVAKELKKLFYVNKEIHDYLINFTYLMANQIDIKIETYEKKIEASIKKYNLMKNRNLLKTRGLRRGYVDLLDIIKGYDVIFLDMKSILMDVYTIARMFTQEGDEIIVFAGVNHIINYDWFFNGYLVDPILKIDYQPGVSCLKNDDIAVYINIDLYKKNKI